MCSIKFFKTFAGILTIPQLVSGGFSLTFSALSSDDRNHVYYIVSWAIIYTLGLSFYSCLTTVLHMFSGLFHQENTKSMTKLPYFFVHLLTSGMIFLMLGIVTVTYDAHYFNFNNGYTATGMFAIINGSVNVMGGLHLLKKYRTHNGDENNP